MSEPAEVDRRRETGKLAPMRAVGLETEYGIVVENSDRTDRVAMSNLFFDSWRTEAGPNWDFSMEQPSKDARGLEELPKPRPTRRCAQSPPTHRLFAPLD